MDCSLLPPWRFVRFPFEEARRDQRRHNQHSIPTSCGFKSKKEIVNLLCEAECGRASVHQRLVGDCSGTTVYIYESEAQSKEERKQQPKRNNYMNYNITTSARLNCYPLLSDFDTTYNFNCLYKAPPRIPDVLIPQGEILQLVSALIYDINHALAPIRHIATRKDLKKFLSVIAGCVFSQFEQLLQLLNLVLLKLPIASHITSDVREKQRSGGCIWREGDAGVQPALHSVRGESFKQYLIGSVQRQEKSLKDRLYQLSTLAQILL